MMRHIAAFFGIGLLRHGAAQLYRRHRSATHQVWKNLSLHILTNCYSLRRAT